MFLFQIPTRRARRPRTPDSFLESLRKELTDQWQEQSNQMLQEWLNQANQSLEQALGDALSSLTQPTIASGGTGGLPPFNPFGTPSGTGDTATPFAGFAQSLGRVFSAILSHQNQDKETSVRQEETARSLASNREFRLSKGQQQTQVAQAAAQGQRNL